MNTRRSSAVLALTFALMLALTSVASAAVKLGVIRMPTVNGSVNVRSAPAPPVRARLGLPRRRVIILSAGKYWDNVRVIRTGLTGYVYNRYIVRMVDVTTLSNWGSMARIKTKYATSTVCLRSGPGTSTMWTST